MNIGESTRISKEFAQQLGKRAFFCQSDLYLAPNDPDRWASLPPASALAQSKLPDYVDLIRKGVKHVVKVRSR